MDQTTFDRPLQLEQSIIHLLNDQTAMRSCPCQGTLLGQSLEAVSR